MEYFWILIGGIVFIISVLALLDGAKPFIGWIFIFIFSMLSIIFGLSEIGKPTQHPLPTESHAVKYDTTHYIIYTDTIYKSIH